MRFNFVFTLSSPCSPRFQLEGLNIESDQDSHIPEISQLQTGNLSLIADSSNSERNNSPNEVEDIFNIQGDLVKDDETVSNVKQLSSGLYNALKQTINKFDSAFCELQTSQKDLQEQLITLDQG
ncbi:unnamed protein product [Trichobilharzia regenti]|nr:unnamed protein product [Trichobilharzia regenti]